MLKFEKVPIYIKIMTIFTFEIVGIFFNLKKSITLWV